MRKFYLFILTGLLIFMAYALEASDPGSTNDMPAIIDLSHDAMTLRSLAEAEKILSILESIKKNNIEEAVKELESILALKSFMLHGGNNSIVNKNKEDELSIDTLQKLKEFERRTQKYHEN
ncbi:hypothetical protein [Kaarinaea lacus]